jgi:hypothetical protein
MRLSYSLPEGLFQKFESATHLKRTLRSAWRAWIGRNCPVEGCNSNAKCLPYVIYILYMAECVFFARTEFCSDRAPAHLQSSK